MMCGCLTQAQKNTLNLKKKKKNLAGKSLKQYTATKIKKKTNKQQKQLKLKY